MRIRFGGKKNEASCVYCREGFEPNDPGVHCHGCATALHQECRDELSRCPTLGCGGRWSDRAPRPTRTQRPTGVQGVTLAPARSWSSLISKVVAVTFAVGVLAFGLNKAREVSSIERAQSGKLNRDEVTQVIPLLDQVSDRVREELLKGLRSAPRSADREILEAFAKEPEPIRDIGRKLLAERLDRWNRLRRFGDDAWSMQNYLFGDPPAEQRILATQVLASIKPRHLHGTAILVLRRMATSSQRAARKAARDALRVHDGKAPATIRILEGP